MQFIGRRKSKGYDDMLKKCEYFPALKSADKQSYVLHLNRTMKEWLG